VRSARRRVIATIAALTVALAWAVLPAAATPTGGGLTPASRSSAGNTLNAASCVDPGDCVAVGQLATGSGEVALIDEETSSVWSTVRAPIRSDSAAHPSNSLAAVECPAVGDCVAVGQFLDTAGHEQAQLDVESSGIWSALGVPLPSGASTSADSSLVAVNCFSVGSCVAVGQYTDDSDHVQALVVAQTSGSWSAVSVPLPNNADTADADNSLDAVSCTSSTDCAAVGGYLAEVPASSCVDDDCQEPLLVVESGASWSAPTAPLPPDATSSPATGDILNTINCSSVGNCVAGGSYVDTHGNNQLALDEDTAGTWSAVVAPLPADASSSPDTNAIDSVTCTSDDNCVAVGQYDNDTKTEYPEGLIETETSGTWAAATAPLPSDARANQPNVQLNDLSCSSSTSCVAVGTYVTSLGDLHPKALLDVDFSGSWLAGFVELPSDASGAQPYSQLAQVACTTSISCIAVGSYVTSQDVPQVLLDQWSVALTTIPVVPGAPTDVVVRIGPAHARISWTAPAEDGGSHITRYVVTASPGGETCVTTGATSCPVWPLVAGARYSFRVVAENELGASAPSPPSAIFTIPPALTTVATIDPFPANSPLLTAALQRQIVALAKRIIVDGDTHVDLVGYSDDTASPRRSRIVSRERSRAVRTFLLAQLTARHIAGVTIIATGLGATHPVASNATAGGRARNRRVHATAT
jgi:outer membrane protein OmpA-like peptidoglycan-associated protein